MKNQPIFIVGVPRSGTTLLAAMLAAHSRISCGPETHFFRKLARIDANQLVSQDTWPNKAIDFVCSIEHTSFSNRDPIPLIEKFQIDRDQIAAYLCQKEPSIPNMLSSVTEQYMLAMGKVRWAEKTPDHILNLEQIRTNFPDSPVIRIIRDPRDVAISLTKVPWGAMSFLEALLLWKRLDEASDPFFQTDRLCYSLHYEDLISSPEIELTRLCQFIGEEFECGMLDTSQTGKQVNSRHVPWKAKASQPIDASHRAIWRKQLNGADNHLAEAIMGGRLLALGYPIDGTYTRLGEVYPSLALVTKFTDELKSLSSTGIRFWKSGGDEATAVKIYLGDPVIDGWLQGDRIKHILGAFNLLMIILKTIVSRQSIYWVSGGTADTWSGYSSFVLKKVLSPYKYPLGEA